MKSTKQPKILFFTKGSAPSAAERLSALELGVPVMWRNGAAHVVGEVEPCDGVAGAVPKCYKDKKIKSAKTVLADYQKELKAAIAGEAKAPDVDAVVSDDDDEETAQQKLADAGNWPG